MGNSQASSSSGSRFGAQSTGDEVAHALADRAKGKVVLVTGGGGGLGYETARVLASVGATVYITCRTQEAADRTAKDIQAKAVAGAAKTSNSPPDAASTGSVHGLALDLSSLQSVEKGAAAFLATQQPLHILINNAGVMGCLKSKTVDGFEQQFGVNHLGHFHLTNLLVDKLKSSGAGSRVVVVSSLAHYLFAPASGILFHDLSGDKYYNPWERYGHSKLANVLHARALQARHPELTVSSLHPGNIPTTDLARNGLHLLSALRFLSFTIIKVIMQVKSIPQGVATSVFCALDPSIEQYKGEYFMDCAPNSPYTNPLAKDDALANKLWLVSEKLVKNPSADISDIVGTAALNPS